jgi:hypothetical protein
MKKLVTFFLSAALVGSVAACGGGQTIDKKSSTAPPAKDVSQSSQITKNNGQSQLASVPASTTIDTDLQQELSTGKNKNNDRFTLKVKSSNPTLKDSVINGHLENVQKAAKGKKATFNLVFDDIVLKNGDMYPVDMTLVNTQVETKTKGQFLKNAGIIIGGTVAGRFVGDKTKFKHGALAGGAAATAYVLSSPGGEVQLKKGTDVKLKMKTALNP